MATHSRASGRRFVGNVEQQAWRPAGFRFSQYQSKVSKIGIRLKRTLSGSGEIAAAKAFDRLLQLADGTRQVQSQPVAEPDGGGHHKEVFRLQEPRADV